jgi:hypothetical protein
MLSCSTVSSAAPKPKALAVWSAPTRLQANAAGQCLRRTGLWADP